MIFQKQGSYSTVLFIPREYFSFKILKLNANKLNYPAKNYFIIIIFQKRRSFPIVLFKPEGFLALILCQFWHEHLYSVSYQRDQAIFDSFKVPHQVIAAVDDTSGLGSGQHNEINFHPSSKCRQLSISSLEMTILWLCISMLCSDDTLRSSFATCTSRGHVTVVGRSRLKTIQWLVFCFPRRLYFERMVLLFSRFS